MRGATLRKTALPTLYYLLVTGLIGLVLMYSFHISDALLQLKQGEQVMKVMRVYPAKPADVYLYATCLVDLFDPVAGLDAIALIEREGIRVHFVEKQTLRAAGLHLGSRGGGAQGGAKPDGALPEPWPVVVLSGSCGGMMHHHYRRLLFPESPEVADFAIGCSSSPSFWPGSAGCAGTGGEASIVMHTSCSARREMQVHTTARSLLGQLDGVTLHEQAYESECCGFGGTFSVRHPTSARPWWRTRPATCWPPAPTPW